MLHSALTQWVKEKEYAGKPYPGWAGYFVGIPEEEWGPFAWMIYQKLPKKVTDGIPEPDKPSEKEMPKRLEKWRHRRWLRNQEDLARGLWITLENGRLRLLFPYDPEIKDRVKKLAGSGWNPDGKYWHADVVQGNLEVVQRLSSDFGFEVSPMVEEALLNAVDPPIGSIWLDEKGIGVKVTSGNWDIISLVVEARKEAGGSYSAMVNWFPKAFNSVKSLQELIEKFDFRVEDEVTEYLDSVDISWL